MNTTATKTCYRCECSVPELIDSGDLYGGFCGICDDCRLRLCAASDARTERLANLNPGDPAETR